MLRLSRGADERALRRFCGGSLFGAYALCRFLCYGNRFDFAKLYLDEQNGAISTVVSVFEHTAVVLTTAKTDYEELRLFLPVCGAATVMTDEETAKALGLPVEQKRTAFIYSGENDSAFEADADAPLREVYSLICQSIPDSFSDSEESYLHFLSDFTFRRSRGFARLRAVIQDGSVCACALTAAETDTAAVISGVASEPAVRGKGFGKRVVLSLANALRKEQKDVHVIALNESAKAFYQHLGFRPNQTVVWLNVQ